MDFLRLLEGIRTPFVSGLMAAVTFLGDETCFIVLGLAMLWCVRKRSGYYMLSVGFLGIGINQLLKLWFRIPRPWVLDPEFTIVEAARAAATGYSFPSGHTQNIVGTLGVVGVSTQKGWLRALCAVLMILVPFSRMYLGVHTPLDVGASFFMALALVALLYPCFRTEERFRRWMPWLFAVTAAVTGLYLAFVLRYAFPADVDPAHLADGLKNAYRMAGCALGLMISYAYDRKKLRFETAAPLLGQALKLTLGFVAVMALRIGLKPLLAAVMGGSPAADLIRYFLIVIFAGCVWPNTFPLFAKVGRKRPETEKGEA